MKLVLRGCASPFTGQVEGLPLGTLAELSPHSANYQQILGLIHGRFWLACDCHSENAPLLTVRKRNGHYFLANIHGRSEHVAGCPFNSATPPPEFNRTDISFAQADKPIACLDELLALLFLKSHFNQLQPERGYKDNMNVILHDGVQEVFIDGIPLEDLIVFGTKNFGKAKSLSKDKPSFIFDVVDTIEQGLNYALLTKFYSKDHQDRFKIFDNLTTISSKFALDIWDGPFAVLILCQDGLPSHAIYIPVLSKSQWFPMFFTKERHLCNVLCKSLNWYAENTGLAVTVSRQDHTCLELAANDEVVKLAFIDRTLAPADTGDCICVDLISSKTDHQLIFDKVNAALKSLLRKTKK